MYQIDRMQIQNGQILARLIYRCSFLQLQNRTCYGGLTNRRKMGAGSSVTDAFDIHARDSNLLQLETIK